MGNHEEIRAKVLAHGSQAAKNAMIISDIYEILAEDELKEK